MGIKILVKISTSWADEFQAEGFIYCEKKFWDALIKQYEPYFKPGAEISFGTNEGLEFSNWDNYLDVFNITVITTAQYKMLQKLFPDAEVKYERWPTISKQSHSSIHLACCAFGIFPLVIPTEWDRDELIAIGENVPLIKYPDRVRSNVKEEQKKYKELLDEFFDGKELPEE